mgnify:CR=1 FL=1
MENKDQKEEIENKEEIKNDKKESNEDIESNKEEAQNQNNEERIGQKEKDLLLKIINDQLNNKLEHLEKKNKQENKDIVLLNKTVKDIQSTYINIK